MPPKKRHTPLKSGTQGYQRDDYRPPPPPLPPPPPPVRRASPKRTPREDTAGVAAVPVSDVASESMEPDMPELIPVESTVQSTRSKSSSVVGPGPDEPAGRGAGAIRPSWEGPSSGLARTPLPPSPPRLPPTARSATGSNRAPLGQSSAVDPPAPPPPPKFKAPPPPPQVEVEEIVEVDSDPYVDPDPAPPPQVGEIMIARQVDGHPEVILRRAPKKARVGEVPNGEEVTVQWVEGEFVCVRWRDIEGVARVENLVRRSSNRDPLRTSSAVDPAPPPPPQVGEIMIARQVDGHPDVILRRAPKKARVAEVPNGQEVTVVDNEGEFVLVRWGA